MEAWARRGRATVPSIAAVLLIIALHAHGTHGRSLLVAMPAPAPAPGGDLAGCELPNSRSPHSTY